VAKSSKFKTFVVRIRVKDMEVALISLPARSRKEAIEMTLKHLKVTAESY